MFWFIQLCVIFSQVIGHSIDGLHSLIHNDTLNWYGLCYQLRVIFLWLHKTKICINVHLLMNMKIYELLSVIKRFATIPMSNETGEEEIRYLKWRESLLCWINSFQNVKQRLTSLTELTDTRFLINCILAATADKSLLPGPLRNDSAVKSLQFETYNIVQNHKSNFSKILATFTCFFNKPIDRAISLPGLLSGCEQEFVKLLLIFLTYAVLQKPNEAAIMNILNLDKDVQITLAYLIIETFKNLCIKQIQPIRSLVSSIEMEFSPSHRATIKEWENLMSTESSDSTETVTPPLHASPDPLPLDKPDVQHLSPLYNTPVLRYQDSIFSVKEKYYEYDPQRSLRRSVNTRNTPANFDELAQLQYEINQQRDKIHVLNQCCEKYETEQTESSKVLVEFEIVCRKLSAMGRKVSNLQEDNVALNQQTVLLGEENISLSKEVGALSGYKDRCEHLQDQRDELSSTEKGYLILQLKADKLQHELNSKKIIIFRLETEKSSFEQTVWELQASSEILGQRKQQLEEELEQVTDRCTQLEADLSALKHSKVEDVVVLDDGERMSERSDEIALLLKIAQLEDDINELRKLLPKAGERDQLEVQLESTMYKELQELRSYQNLFQEDEEDNTSSVWEQLEESNQRSEAMEEILDNVEECQLNTPPPQKKKEKKKRKNQRRDSCGRYCKEPLENTDILCFF